MQGCALHAHAHVHAHVHVHVASNRALSGTVAPQGGVPPRANRGRPMGGRGGELWRSQEGALSKLSPPSASSARAIASTEATCAGLRLAPATPPDSSA